HEDDYTIADMVADLRALTPTDAAGKVVPDRAEKLEYLADVEARLRGGLLRRLDRARTKTDELAGRRCFRAPLARVPDEERRVGELQDRLDRALRQRLEQASRQVQAAAARLEAVSPLNVLARGYSLTLRESDQSVVCGAEQVASGERMVTIVADGRIVSEV